LAPQFAPALPVEGVAIDGDDVRLRHRCALILRAGSRRSLDGFIGLQAVQEIGGALGM
jgi:hypothetical protein